MLTVPGATAARGDLPPARPPGGAAAQPGAGGSQEPPSLPPRAWEEGALQWA